MMTEAFFPIARPSSSAGSLVIETVTTWPPPMSMRTWLVVTPQEA
jgi:hypothetical protein